MNQKILNILKVVGFCLLVVDLEAQQASVISNYSAKKHRLNQKGMVVLTTWASANILSGISCFVSKDPTEKYFYGMNAGWGAVNLAIALPALMQKEKQYNSKFDLKKDQLKTERIFLINAGLDVVYIGAGAALIEISKNQLDAKRKHMYAGFGNSFILQGIGLLAFDLSMWSLNKKMHGKHLRPILENTQIGLSPGGFKFNLNF